MLLCFSIFSSEKDQSTDLSATLSAIFSSYSDSEEEEEEEEEDPNCHSINLEMHSTLSDEDFCVNHGEVEANGTAVATAVAPKIILQQQSIQSSSSNPAITTAVEPEVEPRQQTVQSCSSTHGIADAPVTTDENSPQNNTEMLQKKVEDVMKEVCNMDSHLDEFLSHFRKERIISEVQEILNLFERNCQIKGCVGQCSVVNKKSEAGVLIISWKCTEGHIVACGSLLLCSGVKRGQKVYAATVLLAASIVVSGNNFDKLSMLMKFLNLSFLSESTFSRIQSTCVTPVVKELWEAMKEKVWEVLKGEELALAGDGRNDSPGHSAKYCVYTLMEHYLHLIVDIEVVDKRETGGSSATMEKLALKRLIERAMTDLKIVDLVTDASSMIIALIRTLKGKLVSSLH